MPAISDLIRSLVMRWIDEALRPRSLDEHIAWVKTWGHPMAETVKWLQTIAQWRPIETAPKDGDPVDLWVLQGDREGFRATNATWNEKRQDWWYPGTGCYLIALGWTPTDWMRIPPSPRSSFVPQP